jgi:hypothetical protein
MGDALLVGAVQLGAVPVNGIQSCAAHTRGDTGRGQVPDRCMPATTIGAEDVQKKEPAMAKKSRKKKARKKSAANHGKRPNS